MSTPRSGPRYKLHYFKLRARGETIRLIFKAAGVPFVDEAISFEQWPAKKPTMPTGTMPVLEMGGEMYPDSNAIIRWAARKFGLAGKSDGEQLRVEEALAGADEVRDLYISWHFKDDQQAKADLEAQLKEKADKFLSRWEGLARETQASMRSYTYLIGTSLTVADLTMLDIQDKLSHVASINLGDFPKLQKNRTTVSGLKPVKQYLETRSDCPI